jgi:predicted deacylase
MTLLRLIIAACAAAVATSALAAFDPEKVGTESPAVAARFPDPDIAYATPGFREGRRDFTSHTELLAYIDTLQARTHGFAMRIIGRSQNNLALPLLMFTLPATETPASMIGSGKPTVLIVAQQHGNEPAGSEAALVIATRLADGDLRPLLDRINVLVMPRANPDGGEAFVRDTQAHVDMNRDHLLLRTPEARALALVAREYQPEVVIDVHEFTVMDRWVTKFGGVMSYDALIQYATVGNLPPGLSRAAESTFRTAIFDALANAGLRAHWYFTTEAGSNDRTVSMGGVQPDTWRNVGGLRNAISFLLETRGVGIGRAHYKRRVRTHEITMEALLRATAANAVEVVALTRASAQRVAASACNADYVVESDATRTTHALVFVDPATGADKSVDVPWRSALDIRTLRTRPRPCGYLLDASQEDAAGRLRALGVVVERLAQPATLRAERYRVVTRAQGARADGRGAIDDGEGIVRFTVETEPANVAVPADAFYVSLAQPLGNLVAAALEPDSQNSFAANRLLTSAGDTLPLLRVVAPPAAATRVWSD